MSVVLSFHNARDSLARAVRSVLWQTWTRWELILLDDGSDDGSADQIACFDDPRIHLIRGRRCLGLAARLNEGVARAQGALLARMDADDVAFPERFDRQVAYLQAHPEVDLLATAALLVDARDRPVGTLAAGLTHEDICRRPWRGLPMPHPTWMGRSAWFRANPYDPGARKGQDQALLLRTRGHSRFAGLAEPLLGYRYDGLSARKTLSGRYHYLRALAKHASGVECLAGTAAHAGAALRDLAALWAGAGERVVRRRVAPAGAETLARWRQCLERLGVAGAEER